MNLHSDDLLNVCKGTDYEMDHETEKERVHVSSHEADDHGRTELI